MYAPACKMRGFVALEWQTKLARLSRMGGHELRTRVGQELAKHTDLALFRLGLLPREVGSSNPSGDSASRAANFFFPPGDAEKRARLLQITLPCEAEAIVKEADEICRHRFWLLGYENLDYGPEIDWHLDRVHNKRATLKPWFKIPFLDFSLVGDHKITWELNRHQHLVTLAKAFLLSNDERYGRELMAQWHSWDKANPYPLGINWGSSLEVAFRSLSWTWVDHLLPDSATTAQFRQYLRRALAFHGRYIERFLSTYFSPNTHLLGEAVALFFLGTLYPSLATAERWRTEAWKIVTHEAQRQVRPDGVYFEQSLHYHVYALDFFLYARILAERNGKQIPADFDGVLNRMLDVVQSLSQAGPPEGFGDDDGGRVFNPRRNRTEHMTDPLALGRLAFNRDDLNSAQLTEESIWLFGDEAVTRLSHQAAKHEVAEHDFAKPDSAKEDELRSTAFRDGGLYVMAEAKPFAHALMIDAGPQGTGRCGHGHADALSLRLTGAGRRWLIDPGSGIYIGEDQRARDAFRGTASHNTMRIDAMDQADPQDPFSWTNIPTTSVERSICGRAFRLFSGSHDGYRRLAQPVTHRRTVLALSDGLTLVRDIADGSGEHALELNWHFASDLVVKQSENGAIATTPDSGQSLELLFASAAAWQHEVLESEDSPAYGKVRPAPVLRSQAAVRLPAECGTLLRFAGAEETQRTKSPDALSPAADDSIRAYRLEADGEVHTFLFAPTAGSPPPRSPHSSPWHNGPWSSDAEVLYSQLDRTGLVHLVLIGGTFVQFQHDYILGPAEPMEWFEWRKRDGSVYAGSSNALIPQLSTESPLLSTAAELTGLHPAPYAEKR